MLYKSLFGEIEKELEKLLINDYNISKSLNDEDINKELKKLDFDKMVYASKMLGMYILILKTKKSFGVKNE